MWNVSLLEEVFSTEGFVSDGQTTAESTCSKVKFQKLVTTMKVKLRSNSKMVDSCRKRIRNLVDQQLHKLQEKDVIDEDGLRYADEINASKGLKRPRMEGDLRADRHTTFGDLIDMLSKARSVIDFESCLELKHQLLNKSGSQVANMHNELDSGEELVPKHEQDNTPVPSYSLPNLCTVIQIGEDAFSKIDAEFLSPDQLAVL